jgi:hypothetical protein
MKRVVLFAVVLAVCGVFHNLVLAQEERYLVTHVRSSTLTAIRSGTAVTVINQSSRSCNVQVAWFESFSPGIPLCMEELPVNAGQAVQFCSRGLPNSITACNAVCSPALTSQFQGKAIVSSTDVSDCSLIGVDARIYYTTGGVGPSPANDTAISAISNSKVVFFGEGNLGD